MDLSFINNSFYGMYEVMDMIYTITLRKTGDNQLLFDLFAAPIKDPNITQTDSGVSPTPIEAKSYKPTISQSVLLTREE